MSLFVEMELKVKKWGCYVLHWEAPIWTVHEAHDLNESLDDYGSNGWEGLF